MKIIVQSTVSGLHEFIVGEERGNGKMLAMLAMAMMMVVGIK